MDEKNQIPHSCLPSDIPPGHELFTFHEQLNSKSEEVDLIVSSLDDLVFQYDKEGNFIRKWCRDEKLLKALPAAYPERSLRDAFRALPAFTGPFIEDFENAIHKKEIYYCEFLVEIRQEIRWFNSKISPLFYTNGQPRGFTQRITDISERKKVELRIEEKNQELKDLHREYREIVEHATEIIFKTDATGHFFFVSAEFTRVVGYTPDNIKGKHFTSIVHPEDQQICLEVFRKLTQLGKADSNLVFRVRHLDGRYLWIDCSAVCLFAPDGNPAHIIGFARDITRQKDTEQALRISEEKYRSLFDSLGEGITLINNKGVIIAVNRAAETIFSSSKEEIMNYNPDDKTLKFLHEDGSGFPPETHPSAVTLSTGQPLKNITLGIKAADKPIKWISINTEPIYHSDNRSKPDAVVVSFVDITERMRQDRLLALEKEVLEINAQPTASLKNIVDYFLEGIEKIFPDLICSVLTLHTDGKSIQHLSAPSLPFDFAAAVDGAQIGPEAGSCGTAMYLKQRIITPDIHTDPRWNHYLKIAEHFGLRACWSFPILNAKNEILATIAAYHREVKSPEADDIVIFDRVSNLLRIIIENKKAEAAVRLSNERYLLATKATNDALWDWDILHDVLYWGEGFFNLFGYHPGEVQATTKFWESCIHADDRGRVTKSMNRFIETKSSGIWEQEYHFKNTQGEYRLVSDRAFLIFNQEGKISRIVGSLEDITQKREMEKALLKQELDRQKQVARAVVDAQEKERAEIGNELHDNVNQILSTARLYLELARNDDSERINLINRSINNIASAVDEIRNISRSLVPASIGDLGIIASVEDLAESIRFARTIHVEFYHQGEIERTISDKSKLMLFRIIQEQVTNVLKHAEAKNLIIELVLDDATINLSISDDGKGFDKEKIKSNKGVGLYNIQSRAELFNGTVNMVTEPGKGCKLNIRIPV